VQSLLADPAPGAPVPPILPPQNGFLFLDRAKFAEAFTTEDKMIPPPVQHQMAKRAGATVAEAKGSHAIYVWQPRAVIKLIEQAAKSS